MAQNRAINAGGVGNCQINQDVRDAVDGAALKVGMKAEWPITATRKDLGRFANAVRCG